MQPHGRPRIAVIIPAFNEEPSIGRVIVDIPRPWVDQIIVADNNSSDSTANVARSAGATVVPAPRQGYGSACLAALAFVASLPADQRPEIIVFLDGDYSDHPQQLPMLVAPILEDRADLVIGSRLLKPQPAGALMPQAVFGNRLASFLLRLIFGQRCTDPGPFRHVRPELRLDHRDADQGRAAGPASARGGR